MTLRERIQWCQDIAYSATSEHGMNVYMAEEIGLRGEEPEGWIAFCSDTLAAYELGLSDRATLLNGPCAYILGPLEVTLLKLEE